MMDVLDEMGKTMEMEAQPGTGMTEAELQAIDMEVDTEELTALFGDPDQTMTVDQEVNVAEDRHTRDRDREPDRWDFMEWLKFNQDDDVCQDAHVHHSA